MKTCLHCGAELHRRPDEETRNWNKRKYCNAACYGESRKVARKTCTACGKEYTRAPSRSDHSWWSSKTCSPECTRANRRDARIADIEWLLEAGESPWQIPQRLGMTANAVSVLLRRANRHDLAGHFYAVATVEREKVA